MFYLIVALISVFLVYQVLSLRELKKHDEHLFRFCELRRDAIKLLYDEKDTLSRNDYVALRKILKALNVAINNYQKHKTIIFNFRKFIAYAKELKILNKSAGNISTSNEDIKIFNYRLHHTVCLAFLAYTPFLKSEILAKIVVGVLNACVDMGVKSCGLYVKEFKRAIQFTDDFKNPPSCYS
jgi:hypothetical protein